MNAEKWDAFARRFVRGEQEPANGRDAWRQIAMGEANMIALTLQARGAKSILEVGCGIGRLTPFLARYFDRVISCDTSREAIRATRRALGHDYHEVMLLKLPSDDPPAVSTDAAVVWGNLYDEDWTDDEAGRHIEQLFAYAPLVLLQTSRIWIIGYCAERTVMHDADWLLVKR